MNDSDFCNTTTWLTEITCLMEGSEKAYHAYRMLRAIHKSLTKTTKARAICGAWQCFRHNYTAVADFILLVQL